VEGAGRLGEAVSATIDGRVKESVGGNPGVGAGLGVVHEASRSAAAKASATAIARRVDGDVFTPADTRAWARGSDEVVASGRSGAMVALGDERR